MIVEASAPCRVEIAGGIAGGKTVAVAIDRRAWCRLETGLEGVELESKDALRKARGRTLSEIPDAGPLGRVARVLRSLGLEEGLRVVTQSRVPEGAGLGEEEALAAALSGAAARAFGREPGEGGIAARGGVVEVGTDGGCTSLTVDPGRVEECLLLVQCDAPLRAIGPAEEPIVASVAQRVREALVGGRFEAVVALWREEWEARGAGAPETARRIAGIVGDAGGAVRACGGRGGTVLAAWAPPGERGPGRREALLEAARAAGLRLFPARVDLLGLDVG